MRAGLHWPRVSPVQFLVLSLALAASFLAGCGGNTSVSTGPGAMPPAPQMWPDESGLSSQRPGCDQLAGPALPGGDFVVALTDSVLPGRAPVPHNPAERLVFAQLYETLVNVDCRGNLLPGLAESWACTEDSTVWVFTLRENARFWDGTRVTPAEVKEAWLANQDCPRERGTASPWSWFNARSRSISARDGRRLAISLPEPQVDLPLLLAHPATAVALSRPGWVWPVGSGPFRLRATTPAPGPLLECRPNQHHPWPPVWSRLSFSVHPNRDPRDLAGSDFDLLLVRELGNLRFFRQAPGFQAHPLPWDRLYLLVLSPEQAGAESLFWAESVTQLDPSRDLTTIAARPWADIIFPAGGQIQCPQLAGPVALGQSADRSWDLPGKKLDALSLVFDQDDAGAAELANRLAALTSAPVKAVPLATEAVPFVLDWQMSGASLIRLDQVFPTRCLQTAALLGKAAWIQKLGLGEAGTHALGNNSLVDAEIRTTLGQVDPLERLRAFILPVALSRPWVITRGSLSGIELAHDGTLLLGGLGLTEEDPRP